MLNKIDNYINYKESDRIDKIDTATYEWVYQKEFGAYKRYTQNGRFEQINTALRNGFTDDILVNDEISRLDKLFETLPQKLKNRTPIQVYRGVALNYDIYNFLQGDIEGKVFTDKAFVSTSKDRYTARNFMGKDGVLFKITIPKNSTVIDDTRLPSFAQSFMNTEQEVLLPRNAQFRIISYHPETKTVEMEYIGQKHPLKMPDVINQNLGLDILSEHKKVLLNGTKYDNAIEFDYMKENIIN